jgi:hypothetical protein
MTKQLNERISLLDIQSPTKAKLQRWADLQTEELETLYASMKEQLSSIPSDEWDAWDKESFKVIGEIVSKRRAEAIRQEIARMMELAGMSYGIERVIHQRKASALKQLNKNNR